MMRVGGKGTYSWRSHFGLGDESNTLGSLIRKDVEDRDTQNEQGVREGEIKDRKTNGGILIGSVGE